MVVDVLKLTYVNDLNAYCMNISSSKLEFDNDTIKSNRLYIPRKYLVETRQSILRWKIDRHTDRNDVRIEFRKDYDILSRLNNEYVLSDIDICDDNSNLFTFYNAARDNLIIANPSARLITAHWNISFTLIEHNFMASAWNWDNLRNWLDEFLIRFRETCAEVYFNK